MPEDGISHAPPEQEIAELREEVRRLREAQERQQPQPPREEPPKEEPAKDEPPKEEERKPHPVRNAILAVVGLLVVGGAVLYWLRARQFESTDDAQVDAHISSVASRVAGTITGIYTDENQFVKAGQVVAELDPRDYKAALEQARSQWTQAKAEARAEQPNVPLTRVTSQTSIATTQIGVSGAEAGVAAAQRDYEAALQKVHEAEANNAKAQADVARYRPLVEKDEVSRQQFDQVVAAAKAQAATVAANQASAASALATVEQRRTQVADARQRAEEARRNGPQQEAIRRFNVASRQASAAGAKAQLDQAALNLSYCTILAPVDGLVAKRSAEVGYHVAPGQQILLVSQTDDLWVTANFRETQIRRMRQGQSASIHVDALGVNFDGYLESLPAATGAVTSLLPPENATGNFIKVVQRLPVRIRFRKGQQGLELLRPGMSVEPKVRVE
jgi:membrane fusion protein (multidrug efflux system)